MPNAAKSQPPMNPLEFWSQWSEMAIRMWADAEQFFAFTGPFLESHSQLISAFRQASEAYVRALNMPTHSDITRVAELVVNLEEKVDTLGDTIECVKAQATLNAATMAKITDLEQRPSNAEQLGLSTLVTMAKITDLEQRLNQIEIKLDTLILQKIANQS